MGSEIDIRKRDRWKPARFTRSHTSVDYETPFAVIILNQPIEDKALLVDVCIRGRSPDELASTILNWLM